MAKHMAGKKSAPAIRYRLERLAAYLGKKKIRDVARQEVSRRWRRSRRDNGRGGRPSAS